MPGLRLALGTLLTLLAVGAPRAQDPTPELAIRAFVPTIDGDLSDWPPDAASCRLEGAAQVCEGKRVWSGPADASAQFLIACDQNHLYLAGIVRDDQILAGQNPARIDSADRIELRLSADGDAGGAEDPQLQLTPLLVQRPWSWGEGGKVGWQKTGTQLAGVRVVGRRLDAVTYQFEAAVPFHHVPSLRAGTTRIACDLSLRDADEGDGAEVTVLSWTGRPSNAGPHAHLHLPAPGLLVSPAESRSSFTEQVLEDVPFLLVPLATVVGLFFLTRLWRRLQPGATWLRRGLVAGGGLLLLLGLVLPGRLAEWRGDRQRERLDDALATLQRTIGKLEQGTLASYRGASRDRALVDLLAGKSIARQRYTSYRSLAQVAPEQFGPPLKDFDGLPVRPYWLPLAPARSETFQFDPPLRGTKVHVVLGRPFVPAFSRLAGRLSSPHLRLELDGGGVNRRSLEVDLDRPFVDGSALGRDFWEVAVVPVAIDRELRALTITADNGLDLRLVGLSLEGETAGRVTPLLLGAPSMGGVLTDLRGPYPIDAGIELAPGATAKVAVAGLDEPPQKLWLFYRASYPGLPTANPGARVAEVVLHFADGATKRTLVLEHQVSMFYELAVHNTRDEPPPGSPAAIALTWIDDSQEKHQNLVYPVLDLPSGTALEAIEFRNLSGYRIRFRSVVFGNERALAPQDPVDSPLVPDGRGEWRLRADVVDGLRSAAVTVYRAGRVSETTAALDAATAARVLPRAAAGAQRTVTEEVQQDGARRVAIYAPLDGDGWDGAVLAVGSLDAGWAASCQSDSRLGFLLCLLGAPLALVLLSELLVASTNLRFRLMAVMSVSALVPLGVLSLVLVQVLEGSHDKDVRAAMRASVQSAVGQLSEQKGRLKGSAHQWLHDLAAVAADRVAAVPDAEFDKAAPAIAGELQKLLAGQLPPEWGGGFLRLEWQPGSGKVTEPMVALAGDPRLVNVETPARLEPGVFMQWGLLLLGVRAEEKCRAGTLTLTAGRPIDDKLLGTLAPGQQAMLTDVRGYPLAISGRADAALPPMQAMDPAAMARREQALASGIEQREPIVERTATPSGPVVHGSEVLRDLQDTPRGLLVLSQPDQRATLDLAVGRIPVRAFFLLVAGCLVVLTAFLSWVVSGRISRPIERLEVGAQALSRGALETRVEQDEGGQIGRLTRTFNQMAALLQARLQDLQAINRTMRELAAAGDEATTLDVLRRFCAAHTAADVMRVAIVEPGRGLVVHPGGAVVPDDALPLARVVGPFAMVARRAPAAVPWAVALPECRSAIGVPIVFGGRARGVVLLGFGRDEPLAVDLELLSTVVAQAAIAFERSQLHRFAVQDPVTGAFTVEYFRRRVADEVSLAQQRGRPLAMIATTLGDGERRPRGLRRFAALLRERLPADAVYCHAGAGQFQAALPGAGRASAESVVADVRAAWGELVQKLPENEVEEQLPLGVVVQFPDEAASAEFLFEALRARLVALATPGASAMESDEALQRAGVTAVSPAMRAVYSALRRVAPTDLPVLLEGETGVGKEVLTNLVHRWSRRAGGPLVKVHCAALSETLLASELFGHEKGAFTGADRRKIGRFEQADGGTLFLDEVGDIPLDVQVKLLRVLQEGEIDRVGGTETVEVDVRVIAATNRDIAALVREGRFREDLYYRLQGMLVRVPPLRERKQELAELVEHFRREVVASGQGKAKAVSTEAMDEIYRHDWPGNVRELRNTIFRAMVLATAEVVQARDVLAALGGGAAPAVASSGAGRDAPAVDGRPGNAVPSSAPAVPPVPTGVVAASAPIAPGVGSTAAASAAPGAGAPPAEPTFVLPRGEEEDEAEATFTRTTLPPRLRTLLAAVEARGAYSTQDHMAAAGVSHRTSLRDLQALVRSGFLERVGSRRGAFYRPNRPSDRLADSSTDGPTGE